MNHSSFYRLCQCGVVHKPDPELVERPFFGMAAAVVQAQVATGAAATFTTAESGFKYNREDTVSGTTPIPIPTISPASNYSFLKWLCLAVTASGTTSMSNRRVQLSAAESAGLGIFFQANNTYVSATSVNTPASASSNGPATPAGFTRATSALQVYDSSSIVTSGTGRNGQYCETTLGVSDSGQYLGGAGNAIALPDVRLVYDEA